MMNDDDTLKGDEAIIAQAKKRFERCQEWEATARLHYMDDIKFAYGDSDNMYQWPDEIRQARQLSSPPKPILTVNKVRQHCLQIVNDGKQQKPSIKVRPTGEDASFEAAQVFEGLVRHIEYQSNSPAVYDATANKQVQGGWGYWRFITEYCDEDSFDQEIYMRPINDTLSCYLDPDIQEKDGSDARYGFVFEDIPRDEFDAMYPEEKGECGNSSIDGGNEWRNSKYGRVCEYYRLSEKKDKLIAFTDSLTGEVTQTRASEIDKSVRKLILSDPNTKKRDIITKEVEWFKIAGNKITDRTPWKGKYIPIVRVIGEETVINGVMDRRGHVRFMKDPQRIYNFHTSAAVEFVALQGKSPYIGPSAAFNGLEDYWNTSSTKNYAYLPYNHLDEDGNVIPPPHRAEPPRASQAYENGMRTAQEEMMAASGQYQAQMGQNENAKSGVAINARQRQGDNATYHFIDNLALAIRFSGKILIDLIPKIYDTPRVIKILSQDGKEQNVKLDPESKEAYQGGDEHEQEAQAIFNPNVGKYEVEADIGPAYATKRQEAFNAFQQIASQNPQLMSILGDLLFKAADFPMADELAERMRRMVPEQALKDGPSPEAQKMQQQMQQMQQMLQELQAKVKDKSEDQIAKQFDAETRRLSVMKDMLTPEQDAQLANQAAQEGMNTWLGQ